MKHHNIKPTRDVNCKSFAWKIKFHCHLDWTYQQTNPTCRNIFSKLSDHGASHWNNSRCQLKKLCMKNQVSLPLGHVNKQTQLAEIFSQLSDQIRPLYHVSMGVNNNRASAIKFHSWLSWSVKPSILIFSLLDIRQI